ncbi:MAG: hypothetical protein ABIO16_09885, partial [Nocardioides sp.]
MSGSADPVVEAALAAASSALGRPLEDLGSLGGSDRSNVHRAADGADTCVVKGYALDHRSSWARERVGLGAAGALGLAPRLLATAADPHLVVMEDLGSAPSVADHLLGGDARAADDALVAWACTLGALHARTHPVRVTLRAEFTGAEAEVAGAEPADRFHAGVDGSVSEATAAWATIGEQLGIADPPDVEALGAPLRDEDHHALSPADACPDNNLLLDEGCRLIDFEWAEVRHPAWDASYLSVPWPTCWCSWQIPAGTAERALDVYREAAVPGIAYVGDDAFLDDLAVARACWALISVSWSLATALREDQQPHPASPATR